MITSYIMYIVEESKCNITNLIYLGKIRNFRPAITFKTQKKIVLTHSKPGLILNSLLRDIFSDHRHHIMTIGLAKVSHISSTAGVGLYWSRCVYIKNHIITRDICDINQKINITYYRTLLALNI